MQDKARYACELYLIGLHSCADHDLFTVLGQLMLGKRRAAALEFTPPGGFLVVAEGRVTAASFSLQIEQSSWPRRHNDSFLSLNGWLSALNASLQNELNRLLLQLEVS